MRFAQLANRVWGCAMDFQHPEVTAKAGIRALRNFLRSIGMPQTLAELGGKEEDIPYLAHTAAWGNGNDGTLGGFVVLQEADMANVYRLTL
jgi:alcohol dehydrogenase YqhD (iron-dependent ADH family)